MLEIQSKENLLRFLSVSVNWFQWPPKVCGTRAPGTLAHKNACRGKSVAKKNGLFLPMSSLNDCLGLPLHSHSLSLSLGQVFWRGLSLPNHQHWNFPPKQFSMFAPPQLLSHFRQAYLPEEPMPLYNSPYNPPSFALSSGSQNLSHYGWCAMYHSHLGSTFITTLNILDIDLVGLWFKISPRQQPDLKAEFASWRLEMEANI